MHAPSASLVPAGLIGRVATAGKLLPVPVSNVFLSPSQLSPLSIIQVDMDAPLSRCIAVGLQAYSNIRKVSHGQQHPAVAAAAAIRSCVCAQPLATDPWPACSLGMCLKGLRRYNTSTSHECLSCCPTVLLNGST